MPAAAVIRRWLALLGIIGCKGQVGGLNVGEKKNSDELSKKIAALCDVYVNDAWEEIPYSFMNNDPRLK